MKLEDRLRSELERSGASSTVVAAPSIDELSAAAGSRRLRNRVLCSCCAVAVAGAILLGVTLGPDSPTTSLDVAAGEDDSAQAASDDLPTTPAEETEGTEETEDVAELSDENAVAATPEDSQTAEAVSYTHLTLPTKA